MERVEERHAGGFFIGLAVTAAGPDGFSALAAPGTGTETKKFRENARESDAHSL